MNADDDHELFPVEATTDHTEDELFPSAAPTSTEELFPSAETEDFEELFPTTTVDASSPPIVTIAAPPPPVYKPRSPEMRLSVPVLTDQSPREESIDRFSLPSRFSRSSIERKRSGNAIDIIVIRGVDGKLVSTPWKVSFSWSLFRSSSSSGVGEMVNVFVNDSVLDSKMTLKEKGRATFRHTVEVPSEEDLQRVIQSDTDIYSVRFEHHRAYDNVIRYTECRLFVWGMNDSAVVADLDGTLTVNDVEGHIRTLRLGQYDFLHSGSCEFFTKLQQVGCRVIYLTARPIAWATGSRKHLDKATQHSHTLPPGPLLTNSKGLTGALVTEVVNKNPHVFKAKTLNEIQMAMINAGRTSSFPIFTAGFGNRPTDAVAYKEVGIDGEMVFLIDPESTIRVFSDPQKAFESYDDPNVLLWLLPRLKRRMPLEFVEKIDIYTAHEVALADDREEMRFAMAQARRMQYATLYE